MNLLTINILDLIENYGEETTHKFIDDFECKKDASIEKFLKNNAMNFAKQKLSSTFLIMDEYYKIYGMFTLTHKALNITNKSFSKAVSKRLQKFSSSIYKNTLLVSSFLIAQLAKNSKYDNGISGNKVLETAIKYIVMARQIISGSLVYVDVKNNDKLINFYKNNGFIEFDKRYSEKDKIEYIQMMRFI